jgi:hypothetical protein
MGFGSQLKGSRHSVGSIRKSYPQSLDQSSGETGPFSETLCFLVFRIRKMVKIQNTSNSECYAPSSQSFRFYFFHTVCAILNFELPRPNSPKWQVQINKFHAMTSYVHSRTLLLFLRWCPQHKVRMLNWTEVFTGLPNLIHLSNCLTN